jgi:hypothetical protein
MCVNAISEICPDVPEGFLKKDPKKADEILRGHDEPITVTRSYGPRQRTKVVFRRRLFSPQQKSDGVGLMHLKEALSAFINEAGLAD